MRLDYELLAVEHAHRLVVLAHDVERCVERDGTPQGGLRRSSEEVGGDARAVSAVAAVERAVEAAWDGERLDHGRTMSCRAGPK
jgi:hypothetical protein